MHSNRLNTKNIPCWDNVICDEYFKWLCRKVDVYQDDISGYWYLMQVLWAKEFGWFVPNDDNRVADGLELRLEFAYDHYYDYNLSASDICSVLEMLVALAVRMDDTIIKPGEKVKVGDRFFELICNLELDKYTDDRYLDLGNNDNSYHLAAMYSMVKDSAEIDDILEVLINRQYSKNGKGGLFPLVRAELDQREIEIWYQMHEYLMENYFLDE